MFDLDKLVRPNVKSLTPYSCARDEFQGKEGIFMDANENPYGTLNRYPDPYQKELKASISRFKAVSEENIFLGNGSDEIIDLCFRIFCKPGVDKALTFSPSYGMYEVSAAINDIRLIKVSLYIDFSETQSFKHMINSYPNLIVMHTFSKALGLAAVRVGMAFTNPALVQYF